MCRKVSERRPAPGRPATNATLVYCQALVVALLVQGGVSPAMGQGLAFANARVSSYSAHALYAGYFTGQTLVFAGVLQNPRTQYREALVGIGRRVERSGVELITGVAIANTSGGDYAQFYLLPTAHLGPAVATATVTAQAGLVRGGSRDLTVYPATVHVPAGERMAFGATWIFSGTLGQTARHGLGPSALFDVPGGVLGLHWLKGFADQPSELWVTAQVTP